MRVSHDSSDKRLSSKVETYPLNQSQISIFTEDLLKLAEEKQTLTAWDVYNCATELYKPGKTDLPAMIPQNGHWQRSCFRVHLTDKTRYHGRKNV